MTTEYDEAESPDESERRGAGDREFRPAGRPANVFLWSALVAGGVAAYCLATGRTKTGFAIVSHLAPSLVILGLYDRVLVERGGGRRDQRARVAGMRGPGALLH